MDAPSPNPLGHVAFRRLFAAQVTSLIGTGLTTIALALLAHEMAGGDAGMVLGTVLALKMVAYVLIAPAVGGLVHRLPRKAFLVTLDLLRAGIVLALPWVDALWQVYALIVALNILAAGFTPTFQATIPDILPDEGTYTRALTLSRLAYDLEALASPALAAVALTWLTYNDLFLFDACTFAASALWVAATPFPPAKAPERTRDTWNNLTFGVRSYLATPRLRGLLALHLAASAAGAMVVVNTVVLVQSELALGDDETAWAMAASGAGSVVIALTMPRLLHRIDERRLMLFGALTLGIALSSGAGLFFSGTFSASPAPHLAFLALLIVWFLLGAGMSAIQTPAGRLIRRSCHAADRPAFFSADFALSHAAWLVAYLIAGLAGAWWGLGVTFSILGSVVVLAIIGAVRHWPRQEASHLAHVHEAVEHEHWHVHDVHHSHEHEGWEGPEPHAHPHQHATVRHEHEIIIDLHHPRWPTRG